MAYEDDRLAVQIGWNGIEGAEGGWGTIHPGLQVIHQDAQGSGKGQRRRCSRRQNPDRQMLNAIPGMDHLARVCVCVSLCGGMRKTEPQMIWEYLNGRACELDCGRDVRDPAVCAVCVSVSTVQAEH